MQYWNILSSGPDAWTSRFYLLDVGLQGSDWTNFRSLGTQFKSSLGYFPPPVSSYTETTFRGDLLYNVDIGAAFEYPLNQVSGLNWG